MFTDVTARQSLAALALRLALGVIFIYHGVGKVTPANDWGASWAAHRWNERGELPKDLQQKVDDLQLKPATLRADIQHQLKELYGGELPEDVRKKVEQLTLDKGATRADIQQQVKKLYRLEGPLPDSLSTHAAQLAVAWAELLGGVALLLGLFTRLASVAEIAIQLGAIWLVTFDRGFTIRGGGGYEYNLALVAMCVALVAIGGGAWALDAILARRKTGLVGQSAGQSAGAPREAVVGQSTR
jgi:uncharacterized membrane protein YphA (DoxX/SURF4 family)